MSAFRLISWRNVYRPVCTYLFLALGVCFTSSIAAQAEETASGVQTRRIFDPASGKYMTVPAHALRGRTQRSFWHSPIRREVVAYKSRHRAGTIVVNTSERRLYYILGENKALRYGIGVGREGFQWSGTNRVSRKAEWPSWRPPAAMRKRQPELPVFMAGGPRNPLGARALYLGSTFYRIHGSNEPWTIGQAVSSGCIRMTNADVLDLYERVKVGSKVVVTR